MYWEIETADCLEDVLNGCLNKSDRRKYKKLKIK